MCRDYLFRTFPGVVFFLTCFCISTLAVAQSNQVLSVTEKNAEAFRVLQNEQISVDFSETEMKDVLIELKQVTGLKFVLDETAADQNLDNDALINADFQDTRVSTVLKFMLDQYECTWSIQDGVIEIISEDEALDSLNLMVFNCSDICSKIAPITSRRPYPTGFGGSQSAPKAGGVFSVSALSKGEQGFGGGGGGLGKGAEPNNQSSTIQAANPKDAEKLPPLVIVRVESPMQQLADLIQETVDPDSWEQNGGNGKLNPMNNLLVVTQTAENNRGIQILLESLRNAGLEAQPGSAAAPIESPRVIKETKAEAAENEPIEDVKN